MTSPSPAKPSRAALIVFHGIGEQDPYQPLDAFVRGLARVLGLPKGQLEHRLFWRNDRADTAIRLGLLHPSSTSGATELDISEFYWAPMVQGQIRLRQVMTWLFHTGVRPLFRWADQPGFLRPATMRRGQQCWVFVKTLIRSVLLLAFAVAIVAPFAIIGANYGEIVKAVKEQVWPGVKTFLSSSDVLWSLGLLALAVCMLVGAWELLRGPRDAKHALTTPEIRRWGGASLGVGLGAAAGLTWLLNTTDVVSRFLALWEAIQAAGLVGPLLLLGGTAFVGKKLVNVIGDIPLYVTRNERSAYYKTRREILEEAGKRLKALVQDDQYQAVYVAGHSLGSVIGYDAINCLIRELRSEAPATPAAPPGAPATANTKESPLTHTQFNKLRGLLTFGSPLDKVYYFFRVRVRDDEKIRAQIESSLHGFRQQRSGRDYGESKIAYNIPEPPGFQWLNVYARTDFVSARLDYYRVDGEQPRLSYWNPFTAHTKYWNDHERFYPKVAGWLGLRVPAPGESALVTWIKKIPRISRKSLQTLLRHDAE